MKKIFGLLFSVALLTGCAGTVRQDFGTRTLTQENVSKIERGKTTQAEIVAMFGQPMSKIQSGALGTMWTYSRSVSTTKMPGLLSFGAPQYNMGSYGLTVTFDDNGVVKDISSSEINPVLTGAITYQEGSK